MVQQHHPAGLLDSNIEFFACGELNIYKLKDGSRHRFEDFDPNVLDILRNDMAEHPLKIAALIEMGITDDMEMLKQYTVCNYGGFDNTADIIDGVLQATEYWPCPKRGSCDQEGKLCDALRTDSGNFLTKREIQVLVMVAKGELDKQIAARLSISETTVKTHTKSIRIKTGLLRKADLTRFAVTRHLI